MDEISFADVLTHYQMKLREISDQTETIRNQAKRAQDHIDSGWTGAAADACRLKLEAIDAELVRTLSEVSEAAVRLSVIGEIAAEEGIIPV